MACRLPRGVPLRCWNFLFLTPGCTTPCKPHTKDDIFPLRSTESPSHALNLVGRRLLPSETCSRHPSSQRPRVGLLLLVAPPDCARANSTANFSAKNIETRRSLCTPPHCNSIIPPSPAAPLNYIQCVSLRSRGDIEGGTRGFMVINYEILYYFIFSSAFILPLRQNNSHALKHRCWRQ